MKRLLFLPYLLLTASLWICAFCWTDTLHAQNPPVIIDPGTVPDGIPTPIITSPIGSPENPTTPTTPNPNKINLPIRTGEVGETISPDNPTNESKQTKEDEDANASQDLLYLKRNQELPSAKVWGKQFFRDQSLTIFTSQVRGVEARDSYKLDAGDELLVTVWGRTQYSNNMTIRDDGYIDLSAGFVRNIPRLFVKGMTFREAREAIMKRIEQHINLNGSYTAINLNYTRTITVNLTGEVFFPGSYDIKATNTAFNALVVAGGPNELGTVRRIKVISADRPTKTLDAYKFIKNPNLADSLFLSTNDVIHVPLAGRLIEISGAVKRPYTYELIDGEELGHLIDYAGGLTADAYNRNIQVKRYIDNEERLIDVNLDSLMKSGAMNDFKLHDGDMVQIAPIQQPFGNYITIDGAVRLPGQYELTAGMRISDLFEKSGVLRSAAADRVYIKRFREDLTKEYIRVDVNALLAEGADLSNPDLNPILRPLDDIDVLSKADFVSDFSISVKGAVRNGGSFDFSNNLTLADVLIMAGGIQEDARNSYIEISRLEAEGAGTKVFVEKVDIGEDLSVPGAEDYLLQPYDQIVIRVSSMHEKLQNIYIKGEVLFPGEYSLRRKDETIRDVIQRAGNVTDVAFLAGATLLRQSEQKGYVLLNLEDVIDDEDSRFNYILRPGDIINIPRIKDLVSLSGAINHPHIKDQNEIDEQELVIELKKIDDELARDEYLLEKRKREIKSRPKVHVPFHKGKRAKFYINEYGAGIDRENRGRKRLVYVTQPNGKVEKTRSFLFFKKYPKVEKGAVIHVEQRPVRERKLRRAGGGSKVNWGKVATDILAQATAVMTFYLLLDRAVLNK